MSVDEQYAIGLVKEHAGAKARHREPGVIAQSAGAGFVEVAAGQQLWGKCGRAEGVAVAVAVAGRAAAGRVPRTQPSPRW